MPLSVLSFATGGRVPVTGDATPLTIKPYSS